MYFNVNITGSDYITPSGIIQVTVFGGTPPYLINYRNLDGTLFTGLKVDDGLYFGFPEYTKAINVPIGMYYIDVTDQYGLGEKQTECIVVLFSGHTQENIDNGPEILTFPCEEGVFYWIKTEDGCYINLGYSNCLNNCFLIS